MSKGLNAKQVLDNINKCINELLYTSATDIDRSRIGYRGYNNDRYFKISSVYDELSIFDWFDDKLAKSRLNEMKRFVEIAINLGFTGYVCFKVGSSMTAHGMWAHKKESLDGYSPDGDVLFHSFRSGDNYWDLCLDDVWLHDKRDKVYTLADIKRALKEHEKTGKEVSYNE